LTRNHGGFPKCHYCGNCGRGCDTSSFFNAGDYLVTPASKTGKLEIRTNAVVGRILVNKESRADAVQYFDRQTGQEYQVRGKVVVMGASCIDSTRILLNSKSDIFPSGIGNGSGVIGKYLCEQIRTTTKALLPDLYGRETLNDDGIGGEHIYLPRFNHRGAKRDYIRGFGIQFWDCGARAGADDFAGALPGFGQEFKRLVRKRYPSLVQLHPFGEALPRATNYVTVEGTQVDKYGIPLPKIVYSTGDNEVKMAREMNDTCEMILRELKAEVVYHKPGVTEPNGSAIHEHGTCRMGDDPKRSALNKFNQMHEVRNVFVVDGSAFTAASEKNPTLTILAMAWRATDYLADELKRGNL
jgi:choline dehydrogenase-like flavoprotein